MRLISDLLHTVAKQQPLSVAVNQGERSLTYRDLYELACRGATTLRISGVRHGDRVVLIGEVSIEQCVWYHAVVSAGATPAVVYPGNHIFSNAGRIGSLTRVGMPRGLGHRTAHAIANPNAECQCPMPDA
jgi:acyl-coenzyme A synthetase/AMP-(fatty) acid ligase